MSPEKTLARLRARYGVADAFADRFLPLIERADRAAPDVRDRILALVERTFRRQAERQLREAAERARGDEVALLSVARILHGWEPADWLRNWSSSVRKFIDPAEGGATS